MPFFRIITKTKYAVRFLQLNKCTMPKTKELNFEQRIAVRHLRESGLSYREIGKQVGCHHSTTMKIYKKFATTGSVENKERPGHPKKFNERGD